jgi:hypothetical protein
MEITDKMCELLDIHPLILPTKEYVKAELTGGNEGITDYRDCIRPKHPGEDPSFHPETYYQVYDRKFGFQPNLSILDLLFNEGNEARPVPLIPAVLFEYHCCQFFFRKEFLSNFLYLTGSNVINLLEQCSDVGLFI